MLVRFLVVIFALCVAAACQPRVGDACVSSLECGSSQVCDTTAPDGYCLAYDCLEDGCPEHSVCVDFTVLSACMKPCDSDRDCRERDGYVCRTDIGPRAFCYVPPTTTP